LVDRADARRHLGAMPTPSRRILIVCRCMVIAALASVAGCRSPQSDAYLLEQLKQMGDELNASRQQAADMQTQLDSLRTVVAKQDTLLTRLAGMAGVPR
jgi:septal ring factor EnvC (AmiA/AmiB activator)